VVRFKGEPVLLVAEVESFDGVSVQGRCVTTTAVVLGRTFTHVDRTDEYVHYRPPDYRNHQPASIPVLHRHDRDRRVGRVEYLKWVDGRILAVAEVDGDEAAHWMALGNCYISPGVRCSTRNGRNVDIKLDHLGLVERTTRVGARAVEWSVTSFEERHHWTPQTTPGYRLLVEAEARRKRRAGAPLEIVDHPDVPVAVECGPLFRDTGRPIRTTSSSFDEKVGAAVRAGADPWGAMWRLVASRAPWCGTVPTA
jgi:hypothetical protein